MFEFTLATVYFFVALYQYIIGADWQFMAFLAVFSMAAAGYFK